LPHGKKLREIMQQANGPILAQKLVRLIAGSRLFRAGVAVVLPFIGVVAAFGIAPDTVTDPVPRRQVVQELALPGPPDEAEDAGYWREERIRRGDSLAALLGRLDVDDPGALRALRSARSARTLYQLVPGRTIHVQSTAEGELLELRYSVNGRVLHVERQDDSLVIGEEPVRLESRVLMASSEIETSLFAATDAAGLPDAIAVQMADIFSTDIDFHRDLRRGDHFSVVYEMHYDHGEPVRAGRVLAAEFINVGKLYRAIYYERDGKTGGYYTPDGRNIRKAYLRSPLEFSRITSGFSNSRFHPVLRQWRAHKGIDYAAATGSRVKATGDGMVEFAGRDGSYGNLVVLRHQSKTTTWYGHLSGFAGGIQRGARVSQSQVIGYVGATGLATGPHLHYEFRINDVHQNPLRVVIPAAPPLSPEQMPAFQAAAEPLVQSLRLLRSTNLVRLD
jgi:murein DD-endopeptidase MepM/ murein hydrolase activator NlpD